MRADTTTPARTHPGTDALRLRAAWLDELGERDREALAAMPLRRVDELFAVWLDVRGPVGEHGGA